MEFIQGQVQRSHSVQPKHTVGQMDGQYLGNLCVAWSILLCPCSVLHIMSAFIMLWTVVSRLLQFPSWAPCGIKLKDI